LRKKHLQKIGNANRAKLWLSALESKKMPGEIRSVKDEIRIFSVKPALTRIPEAFWIIGVVFRGRYYLDGVMKKQISPDETDLTMSLAEMVCSSPHYDQIRVIVLDSIAFGGRSLIDIQGLHQQTKRPIILVSKNRQLLDKLMTTDPHVQEKLARTLEKLGDETEIKMPKQERIFIWTSGASKRISEMIIRKSSAETGIPEALRICDLIATAFSNMSQKEQKV